MTVNLKGREIQICSHAFMLPKVLVDDFDSDGLEQNQICVCVCACTPLKENDSPVTLSQYHAPTLCTHKPSLHREEVKRAEANGERGGEPSRRGWRGAAEEQCVCVGGGAQFTEAALNQPITVKENISWCVSSPDEEEERTKGEEGECI